ncbi:uncharacterized protein LOC116852170 isoform X2 [Odontomachus brunneus]|uniref:uncharacterized protein LOC116852170 isoform X2 n=1 Tax=Odontomachus brunneus TaxID=486640 RepID=UPI0013F22C3B|nr:uncharacterized protein LOC116852170 isoform X2 [Odontomachus brunneus]
MTKKSDKLLTVPQNIIKETPLLSYTCGVCETVCPENEINCHPCMKEYKYFYMDEHSYFYPQCDASLVEKIQTKNKEADGMTAWQKVKLLQEEQIIEEVHKRPALWNFKLPLTERRYSSLIIMRKNKQQHQPSGSAGTSRKNSWLHYDRMQFLCDAQLESETISNISASESYEELKQCNDSDSPGSKVTSKDVIKTLLRRL